MKNSLECALAFLNGPASGNSQDIATPALLEALALDGFSIEHAGSGWSATRIGAPPRQAPAPRGGWGRRAPAQAGARGFESTFDREHENAACAS